MLSLDQMLSNTLERLNDLIIDGGAQIVVI